MISLYCPQCGGRFTVADEYAGRRYKCNACGSVMDVPCTEPPASPAPDTQGRGGVPLADGMGRSPPSSPYEQSGVGTAGQLGIPAACPSCRKPLQQNATICVACGIYVPNGRPVMTSRLVDMEELTHKARRALKLIGWLSPIGICPIYSEARGRNRPYATWGISILTILVSIWFWTMAWPNSPEMGWAKFLMLWPGNARPTANDIRNAYEGPTGESFGDAQAMRTALDAEGEPDLGWNQDDAIILAAYDSLTPQQQVSATYRGYQLLTYMLLHGGIMHLAGNLLFFLVFGSRVNEAVGNLRMLMLYPVLGVLAAWIFLATTPPGRPIPMLGASGAIMGMAGMYLVLFPIQKVFMAAWIRPWMIGWFRLGLKVFGLWGVLVVGAYIALDVLYLWIGDFTGVAHWAHVGGFLSGTAAALVLLCTRQVWTGCDLVSLVLGRHAWGLLGIPAERQPKVDSTASAR